MISVLLTGTELIEGRTHDRNAHFIAQRLNDLGANLARVVICDDALSSITDSIRYLAKFSKLIIISGGLGPTTDDLTREAIAELTSLPLELREDQLQLIKALFEKRKRTFNPSNQKQALFPKNSSVITNPVGTAPGFAVDFESCKLVCLPGVPWELTEMFEASVLPIIKKLFPEQCAPKQRQLFRVFGVPESKLGELVSEAIKDAKVEVSYRASFPEVQVLLKAANTLTNFTTLASNVGVAIKAENIFSESAECDLIQCVHNLLIDNNLTISVAESCTAGMLGAALTTTPGSSQYFLGGVQSYANSAKEALLGVKHETLNTHGAVSRECALEMAQAVKKLFNSDIALSITGIAGPDGGTPEKPVGTLFIGIASKGINRSLHFFLPWPRPRYRQYAVHAALDCVRRLLLGLELREHSQISVLKS